MTSTRRRILIAIAAATTCCACGNIDKPGAGGAFKPVAQVSAFATPEMLNGSVASTNGNFYQSINADWLKNNPVPADKGSVSSFSKLFEKVQNQLKTILEAAAADRAAKAGSTKRLLGDVYRACMDTDAIDRLGAKPIQAMMERIRLLDDQPSDVLALAYTIADMHSHLGSALFSFTVDQDQKNIQKNVVYLSQGGLGLPNKEYYFPTDASGKAVLAKYRDHLRRVFQWLGDSAELAETKADAVLNLETELARVSMSPTELRDPLAQYNPMTVAQFNASYPKLELTGYLMAFFMEFAQAPQALIVSQPRFFAGVNKLLANPNMEQWKAYLSYHWISDQQAVLDSGVRKIYFDFYGRVLDGKNAMQDRWKDCAELIDADMGDVIGKAFVEAYFPESSKQHALQMISNLKAAYAERMKAVDWMSEETKQKALDKLSKITVKVGYPNVWDSFDPLTQIESGTLAQYHGVSTFYRFRRTLHWLAKPVDRSRWDMSASTVNAYYNPNWNEIVFPAAILQAPFFDANADDAYNYGGIGAVIGHEITHGFDDQGRLYDAEGKLNNWWTDADAAAFNAKTKMLVNQFNGYTPIEGHNINGSLTLGENLADLGGITISFHAYEKSMAGKTPTMGADGLTPEQRIFVAWAKIWAENYKPEALISQLNTDPHSPGEFRCNGPLSNMSEFYDAFGVKAGDAMYRKPEERVKIW